MGKGTIISNSGEGLYTVKLEQDESGINASLARIQAGLADVLSELSSRQDEIEELFGADYLDDLPDPDPDPDPDEPPPDDFPPGDALQGGSVT